MQLKIKDRHLKVYTVDDTGIVVKHFKNRTLPTEDNFAFENVRRDKFFYINRSPILLIVGGLFLIIFVMALMDNQDKEPTAAIYISAFGAVGLLSLILYFVFRQKVYFLKTFKGKFIKFKVKNNEREISEFIKAALEKRDKYLKQNYGVPNPYLSFDSQHSNFNIMLKEKIITRQEFQDNIEQLKQLFNQTIPRQTFIGYSQN